MQHHKKTKGVEIDMDVSHSSWRKTCSNPRRHVVTGHAVTRGVEQVARGLAGESEMVQHRCGGYVGADVGGETNSIVEWFDVSTQAYDR